MPRASPTRERLNQAGVLVIIKQGKRLSRPGFDLRFLSARVDSLQKAANLAIAVPKRLLKSAVARNRIKRLVREVFRGHSASRAPLNMLVTYNAKDDGKSLVARRRFRAELSRLLNDVLQRTKANQPTAGRS